jgi:hypothetical protein
MVPPTSSHEPVSTCHDVETMSSQNVCDIHHALSIIAAQRRQHNQRGKITITVLLRTGSNILMHQLHGIAGLTFP